MQSTDGTMLEAPSEPTTGGGGGGTKQPIEELKVYEGAGVRLVLNGAAVLQGVGGHLSADPEATGGADSASYAPAAELFFAAGTLEEPTEELVLHVYSGRNPEDGARHHYRVDFGPRGGLVGIDVLVTANGVDVAWRRCSRAAGVKPKPFDVRTRLPVGGEDGFFAGSPDRVYLRRDGLLKARSGWAGDGYESLAAITEISFDESGGGEGGQTTYTGGDDNAGSGGGGTTSG